MKTETYDVTVIGAGPAGIAAACEAAKKGASVLLVEREEKPGGILKQCVHDGFGLFRYGERLTGPEYAFRNIKELGSLPVRLRTSTFLTELQRGQGREMVSVEPGSGSRKFLMTFVSPDGVLKVESKTVVTATGCRERSGRQIFLHGDRPAGIFTAGQAQEFVNMKGYLPGKRPLILGSGDIGLIMARRLTLEGASVAGVYEIKPEPAGLTRNIAQCLEDFGIPLNLSRTVKTVYGRKRVEGVTLCSVDEKLKEIPGTEERIECDSLILSVGLIPENEILTGMDVTMDPVTGGPETDQDGMTSVPGLYTCGNALHVNDLVDYVSAGGDRAGRAAAGFARRGADAEKPETPWAGSRIKIERQGDLLYQVPAVINTGGGETVFYFRSSRTMERGKIIIRNLEGQEIFSRSYSFLKPPEMENFKLPVEVFREGVKSSSGSKEAAGFSISLGEENE